MRPTFIRRIELHRKQTYELLSGEKVKESSLTKSATRESRPVIKRR
jgi:hypothetical protein